MDVHRGGLICSMCSCRECTLHGQPRITFSTFSWLSSIFLPTLPFLFVELSDSSLMQSCRSGWEQRHCQPEHGDTHLKRE